MRKILKQIFEETQIRRHVRCVEPRLHRLLYFDNGILRTKFMIRI